MSTLVHPRGRIVPGAPALHPDFHAALEAVLCECRRLGLPVHVFEAWRTPQRQEALYARGRTAPGGTVTNARAWQSFHQYGVACDLVFRAPDWTWPPAKDPRWDELHAIAARHGLRALTNKQHQRIEQPHVQLRGVTLSELWKGVFEGPPAWRRYVAQLAESFPLGAPSGYGSAGDDVTERPALEA